MDIQNLHINTQLIHPSDQKESLGSITLPIYQTSTFEFQDAQHGADLFAGKENGFIYTRMGNPTIRELENALCILERGSGAIATSTGMGAISGMYMALLSKGDHILSTASVYGNSRAILESEFAKFGIESTFIDTSDLNLIQKSIKSHTKIFFVETPANPSLSITDIEAVSQIAKKNKLIFVVDNTFCSPINQRPLELGADIVIHSLTKLISGHSDVLGGVVIAKDEALNKKLRTTITRMGCTMDPHQAFLIHRGLKTLSVRIEKAQSNAEKIAKYMHSNKKFAYLCYPGLKFHPQHLIAKRQMKGFGTIITFDLDESAEKAKLFLNQLKLIRLAVSLGSVESLIQHPASMTHSVLSPKEREECGIHAGLIRLSVGIEEAEDLIADIEQASKNI